jgi:hypothetical protein
MNFEMQEPGGAGNPFEPLHALIPKMRAAGFKSLSAAGRALVMRFICEQITDTDNFRNFVGPLTGRRLSSDDIANAPDQPA